jgi:hypothetical protein
MCRHRRRTVGARLLCAIPEQNSLQLHDTSNDRNWLDWSPLKTTPRRFYGESRLDQDPCLGLERKLYLRVSR